MIIHQPLRLTDTTGKFDILVNVKGGGTAGQASLAATVGSILNDGVGTRTVSAADVILSAAGSVGASTAGGRIATSADNLAAKAAAGSVYVSEASAVTLKDLTSSYR